MGIIYLSIEPIYYHDLSMTVSTSRITSMPTSKVPIHPNRQRLKAQIKALSGKG